MVTRVRIEANGATAAEVEHHMHALANAIAEAVGEGVPSLGQQLIERDVGEPDGHTAHKGRLLVYLNVASDSPQVRWLFEQTGVCTTSPIHPDGNHWDGLTEPLGRLAG